MNYLNNINELYPIRKTEKQKEEFRNYIINETKKFNKSCNIETLNKKHNNIIIGDINKAKVIFTAHYDTPASSLIPNLMVPRNLLIGYLYHFGYPFILALISLAISFGLKSILNLDYTFTIILYLILYFGLFILCTRTFTNKHNKNDNTSGVSTILSLISKNDSDNVSYILFDNEEKGLLGSKAFNKKYKSILTDKMVINLDCVGFGNNVIVIAKDNTINLPEYQILLNSLNSDENYNVVYFPFKGSMSNSDHKNFNCGVGIMTCKKAKIIGYYTPRIHTKWDTVADLNNINFISNKLNNFINKL